MSAQAVKRRGGHRGDKPKFISQDQCWFRVEGAAS